MAPVYLFFLIQSSFFIDGAFLRISLEMDLGMCNIVYKNYYLLTVIEEIKAILAFFF